MGYKGMILSTTFNSSGSVLYSGSIEGTVNVWEVESGHKVAEIKGHSRPVSDIKLSDDESSLVTCSRDTTLRIWDTGSLELITPSQDMRLAVCDCGMLPQVRK